MEFVTHFFIRRKGTDGSTHRCGCIAIKKTIYSDNDGSVFDAPFKVAYSVVSPTDNFMATKARIMALGRLESTIVKCKQVKTFRELPRDFNELIVDLGISRLIDRFPIDDNQSHTAYMGACKNLTPKQEPRKLFDKV